MKKITLLRLLVLLSLPLSAGEHEQKIHTVVREAIVYLKGAQLTQSSPLMLTEGNTDIIVQDIPAQISEHNIQARIDASVIILSISRRMNYTTTAKELSEVSKKWQDSLETLEEKIEEQKNTCKIYELEEKLLLDNNKIGGQQGVNTVELEKAANFLRNRLMEIKGHKSRIQIHIKKLETTVNRLQQQLEENNFQKQPEGVSEIVVSVLSKKAVSCTLSLSYLLEDAGWIPYYDIRAVDNVQPLQLEYKARVWQNSGFPWDKIKLSLSTLEPYTNNDKPMATTWWIDYLSPSLAYRQADKMGKYKRSPSDSLIAYGATSYLWEGKPSAERYDEAIDMEKKESNSTLASFTNIKEQAIHVTFDTQLPASIPSDRKAHNVSIQQYQVPAKFTYYAIPRVDPDAFLIAQLEQWEQYHLLPGEANIFYEGTYVGRSFLDTRNTSDTLEISMGRDKNISINRTLMKDNNDQKLLGATQKENRTFELSVRNKKKQSIDIEIIEQIPVSTNASIEVEVEAKEGAIYDKEKGTLRWKVQLQNGESKKWLAGYTVRFSKGKNIPLLN